MGVGMSEKPLCLDLFCGKGGWAKGFLDAGYRVIGFDLEDFSKHYPGEFHRQDLFGWSWSGEQPRVVVGSPPCQPFSTMACCKASTREERARKGMDLVFTTYRIVLEAKPTYWAIENVRGALKWFRPLLGEPAYTDGTWFLWGNFPPWLMKSANRHYKGKYTGPITNVIRSGPEAGKKKTHYRNGWGTASTVAKIPYDISRGLAEACLL